MTGPGGGPPPLVVSLGEPGGVGPELTVRVFRERERLSLPRFVAVGPPSALTAHAAALGLSLPLHLCSDPADAAAAPDGALAVLPAGPDHGHAPGFLTADGARAARAAIETAVGLVLSGQASGLVTQPIHKANLAAIGFEHPGHTEFLATLAAGDGTSPPHPVMMLACEALRVVPVTVHVPISTVPAAITTDLVVRVGRIVAAALTRDFGIDAPRLAVAGLNPHAGESGVLGPEDAKEIAPAIAILKAEGIDAKGPLPADTLFHAGARRTYDAAMAMYHDQALIPIKTIAFDEAVNVTLGLPFVRTSPDHGTALAIAGKGIARPTSFIAALRMAADMTARRRG